MAQIQRVTRNMTLGGGAVEQSDISPVCVCGHLVLDHNNQGRCLGFHNTTTRISNKEIIPICYQCTCHEPIVQTALPLGKGGLR